jgi:hypothetical protein
LGAERQDSGFAQDVAALRGKRIGIIALARRLSGILRALWRDPLGLRPVSVKLVPPLRTHALGAPEPAG